MSNDSNKDSGLIEGTAFLLIAFIAWGFTSWTRFFIVLAILALIWLAPGSPTAVHVNF
jgi:hypothetical protein